ncbi:MAG: hypothetical protein II625_11065 [Bacilli bacterium]|nr:hypothetical protein [Bacilli bacterium]
MSNKATKTFLKVWSIILVIGIILFFIASKNSKGTPVKAPEPKKVDTSNVEIIGTDIWGNEYVSIDGEKSIFIE